MNHILNLGTEIFIFIHVKLNDMFISCPCLSFNDY